MIQNLFGPAGYAVCVYTEAEIIKRSVTGSINRNPKQRKEIPCKGTTTSNIHEIYWDPWIMDTSNILLQSIDQAPRHFTGFDVVETLHTGFLDYLL